MGSTAFGDILVFRPMRSSVYVRSFAGPCLRDAGVLTRCHLLQVPETGSCRGLFGQAPPPLDGSLSAGQYTQYTGPSRPGPLQVPVYGSRQVLDFRRQFLNLRSQVLPKL